MKRREMVRERKDDDSRDAAEDDDDAPAAVNNKQGCVGFRGGPAVRTLLLLLNSGQTGSMVSSTLQPECVEGLLSYARLLFAQPKAGKLSVLVAAGQQVQTVTSWDPGEQSVEAIVQGLAHWKATEGDGRCNVKQAIQESLGLLFQTSGTNGSEMGSIDNSKKNNKATPVAPPKLQKTATLVQTRLVVVLPHDWVAGGGGAVHMYHKLVAEALACASVKEQHDVESCHAVFLDFSSTLVEPAVEPLVTTSTAANGGGSGDTCLMTTFYKVVLTQALDVFLDLAYLHLELSAIAVKGMVSRLLELLSEGDAAAAAGQQHGLIHKETKGEKAGATIDGSTRLVIFWQTSLSANNLPVEAAPPHPVSFREARTTVLSCFQPQCLSTAELLALPCASVAPTVPEVFQRGLSAKLWENLKSHDGGGNLVLALSTMDKEEDADGKIPTHLCVWRDGRFWLHTLGSSSESRNGATAAVGNDVIANELHGDNNNEAGTAAYGQDLSHLNPGNTMLSTALQHKASGHNVEKQVPRHHFAKKRKQEEMEESVLQVGSGVVAPASTIRSSKKSPTHHGSKHLERLSQYFPGTSSSPSSSPDTILGAPKRHSLSLASLVVPIRGAFVAEEPSTESLNNASKCVSWLLEFTEKNDLSIFPLTDLPVARKELYKKVWVELDGVAKQTKEKTRGQEDLADAISAATSAELPILIDEKAAAPGVLHPVPPPPEKLSEYAPINKRRRCEEVPRDAHGRPVYPIKLGPSLQVYDLGKIIWARPNFHSEKYIWPSGYKSRRAYASMLNSENRIFYRCEIVDDGQAPEFRLTPEDDQNNPVVGISATAVWTVVVKRVGALRIEEGGKKTFANVSGPEYFGYANPTIARLIQQLPNAEKCTKYKRQEYLPNVPMRTSGDTEPAYGSGSTAAPPPEFPSSPHGHDTVPHELHTSSSVSGDDSSPVPAAPAAAAATAGHTGHQESVEGVVVGGGGGCPIQADDSPPPPLAKAVDESCVPGVRVPSPSSTTATTTPTVTTPCEDEKLEPLSWLSEFYITRNRKGIGDFPKRFADCNPGSLFNHYWSAKLRRLQTVELDGRK